MTSWEEDSMYTTRTLDHLRAAIAQLGTAARAYMSLSDRWSNDAEHDAARCLAEAAHTASVTFDALDAALCGGARLPRPWTACRPDDWCHHDPPALREKTVLACECGALLTDDGDIATTRVVPHRLSYAEAHRYFYTETGLTPPSLDEQRAAFHFAMHGTDGHRHVLYDATRLAAWCDAWRAIRRHDTT